MVIMLFSSTRVATLGVFVSLVALTLFGVRQYDYNLSGLLHMDVPFGEAHQVPSGLVLYQDAAYDGMLYYQVARDIPALFTGGETSLQSPYRFQRIALPLLMYITALGNEHAFPFALVAINILASVASFALMLLLIRKVNIHAFTIVCNPAVLVGILYSLTEPLSLLLMVLFFVMWEQHARRLNGWMLLILLLSLLARETTVFLIGLLFVWFLWKRQWKDAVLVLIPMALFTAWQYFLVMRLGAVAFQANGNVIDFPFVGPITLIQWLLEGLNSYRLSALGVLFFVVPLLFAVGKEWVQRWRALDVYAFLLMGLTITMLCMDSHMWGAITSIGRVVTPIYPVYALYAAERDTWVERVLSAILIVVSVVAAIGIAWVKHPYVIS